MDTIYNSKVYTNKVTDKLSSLYNPISEKNYNKSKNAWESMSTVIYLKQVNSFFY